MPRLFFTESGQTITEISEAQLAFLTERLVGEDATDRDYYISKDTLEMLKDEGCEEDLLGRLTEALGEREDMDVSWSR